MAADWSPCSTTSAGRRPTWPGWSMGGFVAQQLAADAPDRVSHLILLGTDPGGGDAVHARGRCSAA